MEGNKSDLEVELMHVTDLESAINIVRTGAFKTGGVPVLDLGMNCYIVSDKYLYGANAYHRAGAGLITCWEGGEIIEKGEFPNIFTYDAEQVLAESQWDVVEPNNLYNFDGWRAFVPCGTSEGVIFKGIKASDTQWDNYLSCAITAFPPCRWLGISKRILSKRRAKLQAELTRYKEDKRKIVIVESLY